MNTSQGIVSLSYWNVSMLSSA